MKYLAATLLTLIVTPCALMVRANVADWRARRRRPADAPVPAPDHKLGAPVPEAAE